MTTSHDVDLWLAVHLVQLLLFGLVAFAVHLTLGERRDIAATVSRAGLFLFVIFYTALDTLAGIATGVLIRRAEEIPSIDESVVAELVLVFRADFTAPLSNGGYAAFVVTLLGGIGWVVAVVAAGVALRRTGAPLIPTLLIGASAIYIAHDAVTAPIAMASLVAGISWIELTRESWSPTPPNQRRD